MNLSDTTKGLNLIERIEYVRKVGLIPIGTICYSSSDEIDTVCKIIVDSKNQKMISSFWNSLYFPTKELANIRR